MNPHYFHAQSPVDDDLVECLDCHVLFDPTDPTMIGTPMATTTVNPELVEALRQAALDLPNPFADTTWAEFGVNPDNNDGDIFTDDELDDVLERVRKSADRICTGRLAGTIVAADLVNAGILCVAVDETCDADTFADTLEAKLPGMVEAGDRVAAELVEQFGASEDDFRAAIAAIAAEQA